MTADEKFMRLALALARKGRRHVSPNPMVGCVITKNGKILAKGYHQKFGGPHAEINALKKIGFKAKQATLYVTLEPCHHFGKTPPCVDAVIESGVRRVVIAMKDPNPLTAGKSIQKLSKAEIAVIVGVCEAEAKSLNVFFIKYITRKMPYVIVKVAQSFDGKISQHKGRQFWFSGRHAQNHVQNLRAQVDAILVGRGTVVADNPQLTVRKKGASQPARVVLDSRLNIKLTQKIFETNGGRLVFFCTLKPKSKRVKLFENAGVRVLCLPPNKKYSLKLILRKLANEGVASVLVEGGSEVFTWFYKNSRWVDEWQFIVTPHLVGEEGVPAFAESDLKKIKLNQIIKLGSDTLLSCKI